MSDKPTFQDIILSLQNFWAKRDCLIVQPYDVETGAGTFNPTTFFGSLGSKPLRAGYVEPARRPQDGRYGENPHRLERHYQYQVILKPAPGDIQEIYLESLKAVDINPTNHDLRFDEDDWESPTLGAWGLGWQVLLDGTEITQFTYFQQMGGIDLDPITVELTYGLERIAMFLQEVDSIYDIVWCGDVTYGDMRLDEEREHSRYNFEVASPEVNLEMYKVYAREAERLIGEGLLYPAYDFILKCSHTFNILDALGVIGVTERQTYIKDIRRLARMSAREYLLREEGGED